MLDSDSSDHSTTAKRRRSPARKIQKTGTVRARTTISPDLSDGKKKNQGISPARVAPALQKTFNTANPSTSDDEYDSEDQDEDEEDEDDGKPAKQGNQNLITPANIPPALQKTFPKVKPLQKPTQRLNSKPAPKAAPKPALKSAAKATRVPTPTPSKVATIATPAATPPTKPEKKAKGRANVKKQVDNDPNAEVVPTISKTEVAQLNRDAEGKRDESALSEPAIKRGFSDWSDDEVDLFNKLNQRGFEPLILDAWNLDFDTLPDVLFTHSQSQTLINSTNGSAFRAQRALRSLMDLGVKVRTRVDNELPCEGALSRAINDYIKWSLIDGDLRDKYFIPVLSVTTALKGESIATTVARAETTVHGFAQQYRDAWANEDSDSDDDYDDKNANDTITTAPSPPTPKSRLAFFSFLKPTMPSTLLLKRKRSTSNTRAAKVPSAPPSRSRSRSPSPTTPGFTHLLPTLYGFVITHTVVSIVSHDASRQGRGIRTLAAFDFGIAEQDVWNGFAVAIVVCWVRDFLMDLELEMKPPDPESDPDA